MQISKDKQKIMDKKTQQMASIYHLNGEYIAHVALENRNSVIVVRSHQTKSLIEMGAMHREEKNAQLQMNMVERL